MRVEEIVVVYDVTCAACSRVARELPELVRVPVRVRSCRDPELAAAHPGLPSAVRTCASPALGAVRPDGTIRWWSGLTGAFGIVPAVRPSALPAAMALLWTAWRARR